MDRKSKVVMLFNRLFDVENEINVLSKEKLELKNQIKLILDIVDENCSSVVELSVGEQMKSIFKESPKKIFSVEDLQSLLNNTAPATIRATVSRLNKKEKYIKNVGRGQYRFMDE